MPYRLIVTVVTLLLAGCGSYETITSPSKWFETEDNIDPPAELVVLKDDVEVRTLWSTSVGKGTKGQRLELAPHVSNDMVYVADSRGNVVALNTASGDLVWEVDTELPLSGGPGAGVGLVLVGSRDGDVVALDAASGKEKWRKRVSSEILSVPQADQGMVIIHTMDGSLVGLDASTGEQIWDYKRSVPVLSLRGSSSPVISGTTVICGFASGKLVAFNLSNGDLLWEASISPPTGRTELERMVDIDGELAVVDGVIYAATFQGDLAAVSAETGVVLWRRSMSSHAGVGADLRQIYISDDEDHVWAVEPRNGAALWKQKKLHGRKLSAPAVLGSFILVGDFEGYVHWLSIEDGSLVARSRVGDDPISTPPIIDNGVAYIYGDGGDLAAFRESAN
ncbi:Outer membrane beta-barrel assembly protein BamB [hydrothermal vent metagenome]|uniref:Outer membrane beta-barrel assembly protein BamB n=1 Tax=hydrothermal vent metagenome TaxID=652676 RepID=A0A3B1BWB1_9ZZZZ